MDAREFSKLGKIKTDQLSGFIEDLKLLRAKGYFTQDVFPIIKDLQAEIDKTNAAIRLKWLSEPIMVK